MKKIGLLLGVLAFGLAGCVKLPDNVEPVTGFEPSRYLGTWYEIARLDHSFEEGLSRVTAEYSLREDGGIKVLNKGYSEEKGEWEEAEGKAYFVEDEQTGYLKVSFFGPFYGAYGIFGLDQENYQYSWVSGPNTDYLWLLAREPQIPEEDKQAFVERAAELGFDTEALIWVEHE
ncbi:lipocalin family protein [Halopseudomonas pelagia]|uniref:Outer membrane lipoprotein Blc n=1 Tax=Halopseudomonas pelagia TaxID=553151 RepID=A0AA91Z6C6_9GAMM|nr:lipocalin family protein [Halopseudomonas pelagia]PCC99420.1 lipocalin [Halopseudomonas pelagia]QFY57252.1 lipocalin [Halopseudomonas pelagia]